MRMTSSNQLKARIKNLAARRGVDPRMLLRMYMMERFLDRISQSEYRENFVLKGGLLISYLIGLDQRTTLDIDTTMQNTPLSVETTRVFVEKVTAIDIDDGVAFTTGSIEEIMDAADYPGLRVSLLAHLDGTSTPVKLDVSTGDAITPEAKLTELELMFAGTVSMLVYPTETVIAEKLHTVISRATFNTRMRDFYDLHALHHLLGNQVDAPKLRQAVIATFERRQSTDQLHQWKRIVGALESNERMSSLWKAYTARFDWANNLTWTDATTTIRDLLHQAGL